MAAKVVKKVAKKVVKPIHAEQPAGLAEADNNHEELIGKFLIKCSEDRESRWSIVVGAPKGRVIIEKYGDDQKMVLADSLTEAIERLG